MSQVNLDQAAKLDKSGINRIFQVLGFTLVTAAILFGCAGRLDWWEAWAYLGLYLLGIAVNASWTLRHDPGVINERGRIGADIKWWDKVIGLLYTFFFLATFAVSGLDARYGCSSMALIPTVLGAVGLVLALALTFWAMSANTFLSSYVRIQKDRGHYVITSGPYRFVRHPMYAGMVCFFWGIPLLLGSWWALIPGGLNFILYIARTALEDKTLLAELPGYAEYAQRVRYRLIPGVW